MKTIKLIGSGLILLSVCIYGCKKDDQAGTFYGPTEGVGAGTAKTFVELDKDGNPLMVGIEIDAGALNDLPDSIMSGGSYRLSHYTEYALQFPSEADATPFKHVTLDWNPFGHEPPGIYDLPHFDCHFYMISQADRELIGANDTVEFANAPDPSFIPANYIQIPGGIPAMGAHWVDTTSSEFTGQPFTTTFIYGSYNGSVTFYEPMVTLDYLTTHVMGMGHAHRSDIPQPDSYPLAGPFPTEYVIEYNSEQQVYRVILDSMVNR